MAGIAVGLSFLIVQLDVWVGTRAVREIGWLYTFGPEGARAILSAIASSMITVAGLTFSITMLTLQLASSQFGPRLLRNFMRDRGNQIVLGTYIATFIYCLLVLRTIRGTENSHFVPHIAVALGVAMALASIAVLIYFIHHVATAIRIETILAELAAETRNAIDRLYPEPIGHDPSPVADTPNVDALSGFDRDCRRIESETSGYVQRVDDEAILRLSVKHDLVLRLEARPGRFVWPTDVLLSGYPGNAVSEALAGELRNTFVIGADRTPEQDLEFSVRRIVEIAQRALSPGVNDPTTALYCVDRLGEAFAQLAQRRLPCPMRFDDQGRPRILTEVQSFEQLAGPAFAAVARYGSTDDDVVRKLSEVLDALVAVAPTTARGALLRQRNEIARQSGDAAERG